jgi:carbon starvation protein
MAFVASTTLTAAYSEITQTYYAGWVVRDKNPLKGWLNIGLTLMLLTCVFVILTTGVRRWFRPLAEERPELVSSPTE